MYIVSYGKSAYWRGGCLLRGGHGTGTAAVGRCCDKRINLILDEAKKEMTIVYFVRHAEPNYANHNDKERELTNKGLVDRQLVTNYLSDKNINVVVSSPYKRALDTVKHFADSINLEIEIVDDFRERKVDSVWIEDFAAFTKDQWLDFSYKLCDGETLGEVQKRNINALFNTMARYKDKRIVVGSHGTALCTIINYFDNAFQYEEFNKIKSLFPWIVKFSFDDDKNPSIEYIDVFAK